LLGQNLSNTENVKTLEHINIFYITKSGVKFGIFDEFEGHLEENRCFDLVFLIYTQHIICFWNQLDDI
jgi:hypothetical protein